MFDPFRDDTHIKSAGQVDRARYQQGRPFVMGKTSKQGFVDLHMAEPIGSQIMYARKTRAEVVERDRNTHRLERLDRTNGVFRMGQKIAFGYLQLQPMGRELSLFQNVEDLPFKSGIAKLRWRYIHAQLDVVP